MAMYLEFLMQLGQLFLKDEITIEECTLKNALFMNLNQFDYWSLLPVKRMYASGHARRGKETEHVWQNGSAERASTFRIKMEAVSRNASVCLVI